MSPRCESPGSLPQHLVLWQFVHPIDPQAKTAKTSKTPCQSFSTALFNFHQQRSEDSGVDIGDTRLSLDLILKGCQQHFLSICPTEKPGARDKNGQKDTKKVQRDSRNPHLCLVCLVCDLLGVRQAKLSLKKLQPATLCDRWSQGKVLEALFSGSKGK